MLNKSMLNNLLFDPAYLLIGLGVFTLILFITVIVCIVRTKRLYRKYDAFMRGNNAESLEKAILGQIGDIKDLKLEDRKNKDGIKNINKMMRHTFQKIGFVKYDALKGMGGQSSFVLTLLDQSNSGILINSMHSREGCYLYAKEIINGNSEITLGKEEAESLRMALGQER